MFFTQGQHTLESQKSVCERGGSQEEDSRTLLPSGQISCRNEYVQSGNVCPETTGGPAWPLESVPVPLVG